MESTPGLALLAELLELVANFFAECTLLGVVGAELLGDGLALIIGLRRLELVDQGFAVGHDLVARGVEFLEHGLDGHGGG